MSVKLVPTNIILIDLGLEDSGPVHAYFTECCYKAMDKYVPKDNKDLRNEVTLRRNSITYEVPYAEYQYKGMRDDGTHIVRNYTTPGTGPYWDEKMVSADKDKVIRQVEKFVRRYDR